MTRWWRLALAAGLSVATSCTSAEAAPACHEGFVTGYVRHHHGTHTADGTPVTAPIAMAAVDVNSPIPFGTVFWVEGAGTYQVRDTGYLAAAGVSLDLMVESAAEARALTGWRQICVVWEPRP